MREYSGELTGKGIKIGIVVSRFNSFITSRLLDGALDILRRHEVSDDDISVYWVPGSFEIPLVAKKLASSSRFDAVLALGAVIRGETPHFNYVASEVTKGIAQTMLNTGVPIAFGVLTTDTLEQAIDRAGVKAGNKGAEAAVSALEMVNLLKKIEG